MAGSTAKAFLPPEKLSDAIANFNAELCTETFLRELQGVLPNDDDRGKLKTHSADTEAELEQLHPADRLMVRLIQLEHLADRVKGMLFQVRFRQNMDLLTQSLDLLTVACADLRNASLFRQLIQLILHIGNYMNGTNYAGGAFGFKIASINRLVDTKSSNGQNLLHFLERQVSTHFPHLEGFLDELAKPSDANRVNFQDMQSTSKSSLDEIRNIRSSLKKNFSALSDGYAKKMFRFSAAAEDELEELREGIILAEKALREVQTYYGEGEEMGRMMQSQDFFGVFRVFTSSYKACRAQNRAKAEEAATRERRAQARAALTPQQTGSSAMSTESNLIDSRLQRLKLEGTPRVKRERRMPAPPLSPLPISADFSDFMVPRLGVEGAGRESELDVDYGSLAKKMMDDLFVAGMGDGEGQGNRRVRRDGDEIEGDDDGARGMESGHGKARYPQEGDGADGSPTRLFRATSREGTGDDGRRDAEELGVLGEKARMNGARFLDRDESAGLYTLGSSRNITPMSIPEGLLWTLQEGESEGEEGRSGSEGPDEVGGDGSFALEGEDGESVMGKVEMLSPLATRGHGHAGGADEGAESESGPESPSPLPLVRVTKASNGPEEVARDREGVGL